MWNAPATFFDDEDQEALRLDYIRLRAIHPNQDILEVAAYVFRRQRDPSARSQQAALEWERDIDVKEAIREYRLTGGNSEIDDKIAKLKKLQAIYDNDKEPVKERLAAIRLHAEMAGEIAKSTERGAGNDNANSVEFLKALSAQLPG